LISPVANDAFAPAPGRLTAHDGRVFALSLAGGFLLVALLSYWRGRSAVAIVAVLLAALALLAGTFIPRRLDPVRRGWIKLGEAMGYITTPILMAIVYYLIVTPFAIARRVGAARRGGGDTYWHRREPLPPRARMERQF
jgi:Saxitoxin biosynthesis operon protein SxtJ